MAGLPHCISSFYTVYKSYARLIPDPSAGHRVLSGGPVSCEPALAHEQIQGYSPTADYEHERGILYPTI